MPNSRPLPTRYHEDIEHLDGALRGELRLPHCRTCDQEFWPASPVCPRDFNDDLDWVTDPGAGTITSWVSFHKQQVELDTGPRLTTSWTGDQDPIIGARAAVSFRTLDDTTALPEFGPAQ